jgi:glycosyltransferase involved in cell wall biosynthesis
MVPKVTVVITVFNDNRIERTLLSLNHQTVPRYHFEIIVVENGSKVLIDICEKYVDKYFYINEANIAAARNIGLKVANAEILLFTDADCVPDNTWIEKMLLAYRNYPNYAGFGGRIKRFKPASVVQKYGSNIVNGQKSLNYLPAMNLPYIVGANSSFKKEALLFVGGFDIDLHSGSDVDICYKLGIQGYRLKICREAIIFHDNRKTIYEHFYRFYKYSIYQTLLFKKYKSLTGDMFKLNPYPLYCITKAISFFLKGEKGINTNFEIRFWTGILLIIEALGVFIGDLIGAFKFRVFYF